MIRGLQRPSYSVSHPEGIGVNRPGKGHTAAGGHKTAIGHIEIVDIMGTAIRIQYRALRVFTEAATTRDQVLGW